MCACGGWGGGHLGCCFIMPSCIGQQACCGSACVTLNLCCRSRSLAPLRLQSEVACAAGGTTVGVHRAGVLFCSCLCMSSRAITLRTCCVAGGAAADTPSGVGTEVMAGVAIMLR